MLRWLFPTLTYGSDLFWLGLIAVVIALLRMLVSIVQRTRALVPRQHKFYPWWIFLLLVLVDTALMVPAASTYMMAMPHGDMLTYGLLGLTLVALLWLLVLYVRSWFPGSGITRGRGGKLWWAVIRRCYYGVFPLVLTLTIVPLTLALLCHVLAIRSRVTGSILVYGWNRLAEALLDKANTMLRLTIVVFIVLAVFVFCRFIVRKFRNGIRRLAGLRSHAGGSHP